MPSGQEQIKPSPGATVQLWLQSPLSSEHRSATRGKSEDDWCMEKLQRPVIKPATICFPQPGYCCVSYHRVSHQSHLDSRLCHRKVSPTADRWWSRWRTHDERAYTPAPHNCPRLSCPHSHCHRRTPRLCWCSVLWTEGRVTLETNFVYLTQSLVRSVASSPESLQPNLTAGSHMCVTPSQFFSSLRSMQSVSPSQRQRRGMHRLSMRHWNSSVWQPPGGRVAVNRKSLWDSKNRFSSVIGLIN